MSMYGETFGYTNIVLAAPTTTVVKAGSGVLKRIVINGSVATGTITIFDNTAASGPKIGTITSTGTVPLSIDFNARFVTGLTIVTATAAQDITVIFQ